MSKHILVLLFCLSISVTGFSQNTNTVPQATIAGHSSGMLNKQLLLNTAKIECNDTSCRITGFTLTMNVRGDLVSTLSNDNAFTEKMKQLLIDTQANAKIVFEDIHAVNAAGTAISLSPIAFKLE